MDKELLKELKERLEKDKKAVEEDLKRFADPDNTLKGDWDSRFPKMGEAETGSVAGEQAADEVEEYGNRISLEHNLETHLREINEALERMEKGTYGKCQNCKGEIPVERLKAYPAAKICFDCEEKKKG